MAIKLVNLLIETMFKEESNDDAILDTLIPNPATGKNIKVRSALSRSDHPAYNTALDLVSGKMGDEKAQQAAQQAAQQEEPPTEEPTEEPGADVRSDLISQGFDEETAETIIDAKTLGTELDTELEKISSVDPNTWKQLSPQKQNQLNDDYTTKIGEKRDNLLSQIDAYKENGLEPPPELVDEYSAYDQAANEREVAGMSDEDQEEHYKEKGETGAAKKYGQFLDKIDIDQELAADADAFDAEETATGI